MPDDSRALVGAAITAEPASLVDLPRRLLPYGCTLLGPRYQIHCVDRSDRLNHHQRLRGLGGVNPDGSRWRISEQAAIDGIEAGRWRLYISRAGHEFEVVVAVSKYESKYLKTALDNLQPDSLLALPACR